MDGLIPYKRSLPGNLGVDETESLELEYRRWTIHLSSDIYTVL